MTVVSDDKERTLKERQKASFKLSRREDQQCDLGQEVSENVLLKAKFFEGKDGRMGSIQLGLSQIGTQCKKTVMADFDSSDRRGSVKTAIYRLMANMKNRPPQMPAVGAPVESKRLGGTLVVREEEDDWDPTAAATQVSLVRFESTPPGAMVEVDGETVCPRTPCTKSVTAGKRRISYNLKDHVTRTETLDVSPPNARLSWTLEPNFGTLRFRVEDPKLGVILDGKPVKLRNGFLIDGRPLRSEEGYWVVDLSVGPHILNHKNRCYKDEMHQFELGRGDTETLVLAPKERLAALNVKSERASGDAIRGEVSVDSKRKGSTYQVQRFPICSKRIQVRSDGLGVWTLDLQRIPVKERSFLDIRAVLKGGRTTGTLADVSVKEGKAQASAKKQSALSVIGFTSSPTGASVFVDGRMVCSRTPCSQVVHRGQHDVRMVLQDYVESSARVKVDGDSTITRTMTPNFSEVTITSTPTGQNVYLDGRSIGRTPIKERRITAGNYLLGVGGDNWDNECFRKTQKSLRLKRGVPQVVNFEPKPVPSAVNISALNERGDDVVAELWADGSFIGRTPGVHKVPKCTKSIEVRHPDLAPATIADLGLKPERRSDWVVLAGSALIIGASSNKRTQLFASMVDLAV